MKKSLVLAMAMALGVTASAYAANPFSDVPAGHWAYDSISKLAAAGVIEGYGDDTFRGDRLMTRYEMAQIVARAMAKGANVDKLAAEFADELDALGARVASLEKKSDNVKITGQIRNRWRLGTANTANPNWTGGRRGSHDLRTRLWFNGQINDGWNYTGMVQNIQNWRNDNGDEQGAGNFEFKRAFVTGRIGGVFVKLGRDDYELIGGDSDVYSDNADAITASYGNKFKITGMYGKPTAYVDAGGGAPYGKWAGVRLSYDWAKWGVYAEYDKFSRGSKQAVGGLLGNNTKDIFGIGADAKFGDFGVNALYLHGKTKDINFGGKNGFTLKLTYKGADKAKVGTWGVSAKYYDQGVHTWISGVHGMDVWAPGTREGIRGFRLGADYTVAKNMVATLAYGHMKNKDNGNKRTFKTALAQMVFSF